MMFSLTLTITHPGLAKPVTHTDMIEGKSKASVLKHLNLTTKQVCDLKNYGQVTWRDNRGAMLKLELKHESH